MEKVVSGFVDCKLCYLHIYIDIYPTWVYYIREMEKSNRIIEKMATGQLHKSNSIRNK